MDSSRRARNICLMPDELVPADIMIVAEQPGIQDDAHGRIFSTKDLNSIREFLSSLGSVHCAYAIKCPRPDKFTKPTDKHAKCCATEYLAKEIKAVEPKHIITLGANAFYAVTGHKSGKATPTGNRYWEKRPNAYVYPTAHQAQAQFNEHVKAQLKSDLKRFHGWISGGTEAVAFAPPVFVADTLKSLRVLRKKLEAWDGPVAVDTETQGLNPFDPTKEVRSIQFCWDPAFGGVFVPLALEEDCYYTDKDSIARFWDTEPLEEAIEIIRDILSFIWCDWHNGKFDRLWLHEWGIRRTGRPILAPHIHMDTLHVAHDLDENRSLKLKQLITSELGFPTYDIKDKLTKDMDEFIPYAARDTVATRLLAAHLEAKLADPDLRRVRRRYAKVIRPMDSIFTEIELKGWPVDEDSCLELMELVDEQVKQATAKLHKFLDREGIAYDDTTLTSTDKLATLLFDELGYAMATEKRIAFTKGGKRSTSENAIVHLKGKPFVDMLLEFRKHFKVKNTYITRMLEAARGRGRLTTSYKLHGTRTSRTASGKDDQERRRASDADESMNLQNLGYEKYGPEKKSIRHCIRARKGWVIAEVDFSQLELRIMGHESQDPLLLQAYREDWDLHAYRARRIMGLSQKDWDALDADIRDKKRKDAKAGNFGFLYIMEAVPGFQQYALVTYGIHFTARECVDIRNGFYKDHAALPVYYSRQERRGRRDGYVETLSGYRRHLPNLRLIPESGQESRRAYKDAVRMAVNTPIQGFGSDLKLMSMIEIHERLNPKHAYLFGEVHDSILAEIREDKVDEVVALMLDVMSHPRLLDELGIELSVPIKAEAKVGPSLGELKAYVPGKVKVAA